MEESADDDRARGEIDGRTMYPLNADVLANSKHFNLPASIRVHTIIIFN